MGIAIPDLSTSTRRAQFVCKDIRSTLFHGRISASPALRGREYDEYDIEVDLVGPWTLNFFGIGDGPEDSIRLARVPMDSNGVFQLQLPDLTQDEVLKSVGVDDAALAFVARERKTGNTLAVLRPDITWRGTNNLPLRPDYGNEVAFEAH